MFTDSDVRVIESRTIGDGFAALSMYDTYSGDADIISLMLGVNDYMTALPLGKPTDKSYDTIYGCLAMISEHLTTEYPDTFIFYMTPFQTNKTNYASYTLADVSTAIKTVAARYNIPVLDMYAEGKFENEMNVSPSDGLHPSQQHHTNYTAPLICEFIQKNFGSGTMLLPQ